MSFPETRSDILASPQPSTYYLPCKFLHIALYPSFGLGQCGALFRKESDYYHQVFRDGLEIACFCLPNAEEDRLKEEE